MFLVLLGLILAFICIELVLDIYSAFYKNRCLTRYNIPNTPNDSYKILCLGDSFTWGIGAGFKNSYPAQLEEILNQKNKTRKVIIYNLGVPSYNSSQTLIQLKQFLRTIKPNLIIVMVGCNDAWNFKNAHFKGVYLKIQNNFFLTNLRISKLFNVFFERLKYKFKKNNLPEEENITIDLVRFYKLNNRYDKAIPIILKMFFLNPDSKILQEELKDLLIRQKKINESIRYYSDLLNKFPKNMFLKQQLWNSYKHQAGLYYLAGQKEKYEIFYNKAQQLARNDKFFFHNGQEVLSLSQNNLENSQSRFNKYYDKMYYTIMNYINSQLSWRLPISDIILSDNLTEIAEICRKEKIELIFSGYPLSVSNIMEKNACSNNIILINHQETFEKLLTKSPLEKYFVSKNDNHCTKEGYRIIAEDIASTILPTIR